MNKVKKFCKDVFSIMGREEMKILPGNLAFYMILAIVPIIISLLYIASWFGISLSGLLKIFEGTVPETVIKLLDPFFHTDLTLMNGISMIVGFILVSNGAYSIIIGTNLMYGIHEKGSLKRRIKSLFMAFIIIFVVLIMVVIMGIGNIVLKALVQIEIIKGLGLDIYEYYSIFKWPAAFILLFVSLKTIYTVALDDRVPSKTMNKGALFSTISFLVVTAIFSWYTIEVVDYSIFYGSLSSFIVLLLWIYLLSYVVLLGVGINSKEYIENKKEENSNNK